MKNEELAAQLCRMVILHSSFLRYVCLLEKVLLLVPFLFLIFAEI